jgi:hypothetical protein
MRLVGSCNVAVASFPPCRHVSKLTQNERTFLAWLCWQLKDRWPPERPTVQVQSIVGCCGLRSRAFGPRHPAKGAGGARSPSRKPSAYPDLVTCFTCGNRSRLVPGPCPVLRQARTQIGMIRKRLFRSLQLQRQSIRDSRSADCSEITSRARHENQRPFMALERT